MTSHLSRPWLFRTGATRPFAQGAPATPVPAGNDDGVALTYERQHAFGTALPWPHDG